MPSSHVTPNGVSTPGVSCGALSPAMSMPSALSAPESTRIPFLTSTVRMGSPACCRTGSRPGNVNTPCRLDPTIRSERIGKPFWEPTASRGPFPDRPAGPRTRHDAVSDDERPVLQSMGHPGGMDAGIVAAVGVQYGPLVEGHEIRVKAGQGDALVRQPDLAGRLAKSSCGWPLPATARPVRARTSPEYGDRSHRGGGHAVQPEFFGGHALHGFTAGGFAGKQRTSGMAVPVDEAGAEDAAFQICLLYTSPSPRDA